MLSVHGVANYHINRTKIAKIYNFAVVMVNVLYIHGMGGGADSRIPSILSEKLTRYGVRVVVRTYDFDPEIAHEQIESWLEELQPKLVVGESLGALHALRVKGVPLVFVSPALNAPPYLTLLGWLTFIPGVTPLYQRIYRPRPGDRQPMKFVYPVLKKYVQHRKEAMKCESPVFAFFGTRDHYRRTGIVSVRTWKKHFGDTYSMYNGTHFMEDRYVRKMLVKKMLELLNINK